MLQENVFYILYNNLFIIIFIVDKSYKILLRNSSFAYFGFGTILVPEVFNPFLDKKNCSECQKYDLLE